MSDIKTYIHRDGGLISLVVIIDDVKLLSVFYPDEEKYEKKLRDVTKLLERLK